MALLSLRFGSSRRWGVAPQSVLEEAGLTVQQHLIRSCRCDCVEEKHFWWPLTHTQPLCAEDTTVSAGESVSNFLCGFFLSHRRSFIKPPLLIPLWRQHDRPIDQHAAEAADHLLHPPDHPHHPLWRAGAVRWRHRCKEASSWQSFWIQVWHREWFLLQISKWVCCKCALFWKVTCQFFLLFTSFRWSKHSSIQNNSFYAKT